MSDDPYAAPESANHTDSTTSLPLFKLAVYLIVPSLMISVSAIAGAIPLWQVPVFIAAGFLTLWGGEALGTWLVAPNLPGCQKALRWSIYSIPVTIWAVTSMHAAYGIVGSVVIALAVVPGLITMLTWDKPPQDTVS